MLSFPYPLRLALAHDARLCSAVRRIFLRTLFGWLAERAERAGVARGRSGAVVVALRFGSALNLNLHFHALVLDGVYASPDPFKRPRFHPAEPLTDRDVEEVVALLHRWVSRYVTRCPRLRQARDAEPEEPLLAELHAASVQGRGALADRGEPSLGHLRPRRDARPASLPGQLCASLGGFSLHAKVAPRSPSSAHFQALAEGAQRSDHAKIRPTWAELLKRVFEIDVLTCPWCGGKRELIALVTDGAVVRRILQHLGLPIAAPLLAPARSPPELEFA